MAKTTTKKKEETPKKVEMKRPSVKTIDQMTFAHLIAQKFEFPINTVN